MDLMSSRALRMGAVSALAVAVLLWALLAPWTGRQHEPTHGHHGSPIAALNGRDYSYLRDIRGGNDNSIEICDFSSNGEKAVGRAYNNGNFVDNVYDADGAGGACFYNPLGLNAGSHDACVGRNPGFGCGPNSHHGT